MCFIPLCARGSVVVFAAPTKLLRQLGWPAIARGDVDPSSSRDR